MSLCQEFPLRKCRIITTHPQNESRFCGKIPSRKPDGKDEIDSSGKDHDKGKLNEWLPEGTRIIILGFYLKKRTYIFSNRWEEYEKYHEDYPREDAIVVPIEFQGTWEIYFRFSQYFHRSKLYFLSLFFENEIGADHREIPRDPVE